MTFNLSALISPAFKEPHRLLKTGIVNQLVLKGGRGSAKSSFASIEGILLLLRNPGINGVALRKIADTLRDSVFSQYTWAAEALGLDNLFKRTVSPMELTYRPTGQKIVFFGADDPGKLKSLKFTCGYAGFLHFEELDQFSGEDEIRKIEQSVLRGGPLAYEIKSFNPPVSRENWANKYCLRNRPGQLIHHSTYLTTPRGWLGRRFTDDAEYLKEINPRAYLHEYMGEPVGDGGSVFENVTVRTVADEEIAGFDRVYHGLDWGWYPDPAAYVKCSYNAAERRLFIYGEFAAFKTNNNGIAELLRERGLDYGETLICDSSDNKSIADLVSMGFYARGAEKKPGSLNYSMKWLQGLSEIVIDGGRCPGAAEEFLQYEYERDRSGGFITGYPDKNNHFIDAARYALNLIWRKQGAVNSAVTTF